MSDSIRIVIVDDHNMIRSSLASFLDSYEDIDLIGQANNGQRAVDLCFELKPDVVLMDLIMPVMNGVEAIKAILEQLPQTRIIALTSFKEDDLVFQALDAGASGYLLKDDTTEELIEAIRSIHAGRTIISPEAMTALLHARQKQTTLVSHLSDRELEILTLLVEGLTNRQIANQKSISLATVKFHVSSILSKLNASSRTEAVAIALQNKLV